MKSKIVLSSLALITTILTSCSTIQRTSLPSNDELGRGHTNVILKKSFEKRVSFKDPYKIRLKYGDKKIKDLKGDVKDAILDNYIYALMSHNAYKDFGNAQFILPNWQRLERWESDKGLAFDVYEEIKSVSRKRLVIAFRGTENTSFQDWFYANLYIRIMPIKKLRVFTSQYDEAYNVSEYYKENYPNHSIITTGHSLGGSLAINNSIRIDGINAIGFNSSPRFFWGNTIPRNKQVLISEQGELLGWARSLWRTNSMISNYGMENYTKFDFTKPEGMGSALKKHAMYRLALGLLLSAEKYGDEKAIEILKVNRIDYIETKK